MTGLWPVLLKAHVEECERPVRHPVNSAPVHTEYAGSFYSTDCWKQKEIPPCKSAFLTTWVRDFASGLLRFSDSRCAICVSAQLNSSVAVDKIIFTSVFTLKPMSFNCQRISRCPPWDTRPHTWYTRKYCRVHRVKSVPVHILKRFLCCTLTNTSQKVDRGGSTLLNVSFV